MFKELIVIPKYPRAFIEIETNEETEDEEE